MSRSQPPRFENLKKAIALAEQIQQLESDLAKLLAGSILPVEAGRRRGRPPKVTGAGEQKSKTTKKRVISEEGRQRIIEAQKRRWAAKKKR
ncbi:hypothetical protein [Verrucomicrobium sp. BvORR034]|uniref:hypothetical protein n=1 Tax=Verrucomicrobium sp. BvORR034 TaxID=1396418 RepID=UPI000678CD72|nr:hypothetical protein [Verrucomicrobium sp. BvORR034]